MADRIGLVMTVGWVALLNVAAATQIPSVPIVQAVPVDSFVQLSHQGDSVVRIEVASVLPTYMRPWEKSAQHRQGGTGFLVDGRRLLTNFHVIEGAVDIRLSKTGISKRWRARVAAVGPDVDLAALEVVEDAESFYANMTPVTWSDELPTLTSRVTVRGYPLGGNAQSVTEGVVSRIDVKNYRLGATASLAPGDGLVVQIDAAINGGNSGGPCFDTSNRVVGVAFQGIDNAQSIGYIIPAVLARLFLHESMRQPKFRLVDVPWRVQRLENKGLRRWLQVAEGITGVVVSAVSPLSTLAPPKAPPRANVTNSTPGDDGSARQQPAAAWLQPNDVVTAIDGVSVGDDGTVLLRPGERVDAEWLITSKVAGAPTELAILRSGRPLALHTSLWPLVPPMPRWHAFDCSPEWVIIGGLVFTPLTVRAAPSHSSTLAPPA